VSDDERPAINRYEWERIMRRVRFGAPMTKYVGMVLAQYGNTDGTNAFPSQDKLARVCEVSEKTVRTALGELRARGLIVRDRKGGMRGTQAYSDVYHLSIPADLLDMNELLPPDEGPLPNRQDVPVGSRPKRNVRASQPVTDASQPVTEGAPTGTSYRLPNPDLSLDQPTDQTSALVQTQLTTGVDERANNVIQMRRKGA
jgi:biotin operon repressor